MNDFKNKMKEKIKLYSHDKYLDGYIQNEYLTDDEDADIFLKVDNKNDLIDSRTVNNQIDLVPDIYDFIEDKTAMLDSNIKIELHIIGGDLNQHDQGAVRHILKEHYAIELYKIQKEYKRYRNKIIKLIIIGMLSLLCYSFFYFYTTFEFFLEVFGFLFSFALWEAFDSMIYDFNEVKRNREDITQNLLMTVVFDEDEKNIQ